ncbi:MAG: lysine--tRNA ligase [Deltaproteobacteria bacterium]|nr:lysine--tRNA ligase [Deltaproteobacteria bacterium]
MTDAERELIATRRQKRDALVALRQNPYANGVTAKNTAAEIEAAHASEGRVPKELDKTKTYSVAGRVMFHRSFGKATFLKVKDRSGIIQGYAKQDVLPEADFKAFEQLEMGDIVFIEGHPFRTKTGELTIEATKLQVLTKALRPLPDKWHGLSDHETRYRQRYVDLIVNPEVAAAFRARTHVVSAVRRILDDQEFLEVETPSMHTLIGGAAAKPFKTHHNALDLELFMRIAPELYLKRLLVGGFERVYEIARCYRNEGLSTRHNPEFTMLEYYWAYRTYEDLMSFTEVMLRKIDAALKQAMPAEHAKWLSERPFTIDEPFARVPMAEMVKRAASKTEIPQWVDAVKNGGEGLVAILKTDFGAQIKEWAKSSPRAKKLDWGNFRQGMNKCDNDGERLFSCYEYLVEPYLTDDYRSADGSKSLPVFVKDYPYETSPLARKNDANPSLVDRFELFVHGRELCNAFSELNDPDDQADRFRAQVDRKAKGAEETMDFDEDYVRALEHGMPPAAGFGMGIDRLAMALTNAPSIRDVILFPLLRKEG